MSKNTKLKNTIVGILLIVLGVLLGATWNNGKSCIGDKIFISLGISPWSDGSEGTHYPALIGIFISLFGIGILNLTMQKKTRLLVWTLVILVIVILNILSVYM